FEVTDGAPVHVVVRRIFRSFPSRENRFRVVSQRRDRHLVRVGGAVEEPLALQRLHIQSIEERTIAFRRRALTDQINSVIKLYDWTANAPRDRRPRIVVRRILLSLPHLPRLRARLENPRARLS